MPVKDIVGSLSTVLWFAMVVAISFVILSVAFIITVKNVVGIRITFPKFDLPEHILSKFI